MNEKGKLIVEGESSERDILRIYQQFGTGYLVEIESKDMFYSNKFDAPDDAMQIITKWMPNITLSMSKKKFGLEIERKVKLYNDLNR